MKTIIIDDEKQIRDGFNILLSHFSTINVIGEAATVTDGIKIIEALKPDLVFLDIQLKNETGFQILETLKTTNFKLIFVTAYNEYAIKAFKYSAFDYLLKPIDPQELEQTLERLVLQTKVSNVQLQNLKTFSTNQKLVIKTTEQAYVLSIKDIIHCEANQSYTFFYLKDNTRILSSKTLKEYDTFLPKPNFIRVHQSHLVNVNYIKAYNNEGKLVLKNNTEVPVSVRNRKTVKSILSGL